MTESVYDVTDDISSDPKPANKPACGFKMPMWLAFLPISAQAKILLNLVFKSHFYGKPLVGDHDYLSRKIHSNHRGLRDALLELRKKNYIDHKKLDGKTHKISVCLDQVFADKERWVSTSRILGKGTVGDREKRANQILTIPTQALHTKGKDACIAAAIVFAYDHFYNNPYILANESSIKVVAFKTVLKMAVQTDALKYRDRCYYKGSATSVTAFWQSLKSKVNRDVQNKLNRDASRREAEKENKNCNNKKNDVIEILERQSNADSESRVRKGSTQIALKKFDSKKITCLKNTPRSKNIYTLRELTRRKQKFVFDEKCFSAFEVIELCKNQDLQDKLTMLVDDENRSRPRITGREVTQRHVMSCLTYYQTLRGKPKRIDDWLEAVRQWLARQNGLYLATPMQSQLITACRSPEQTARAERLEDIHDTHAITLPDPDADETVDSYLTRAEIYVIQASRYQIKSMGLVSDVHSAVDEALNQGGDINSMIEFALTILHKSDIISGRFEGESAIQFLHRLVSETQQMGDYHEQ